MAAKMNPVVFLEISVDGKPPERMDIEVGISFGFHDWAYFFQIYFVKMLYPFVLPFFSLDFAAFC